MNQMLEDFNAAYTDAEMLGETTSFLEFASMKTTLALQECDAHQVKDFQEVSFLISDLLQANRIQDEELAVIANFDPKED